MSRCLTCPGRSGCPTLDPADGHARLPVMLVSDSLESYSRGKWGIGRHGYAMAQQLKRLGHDLRDFSLASAAACAPAPGALRRAAATCTHLDEAINRHRPGAIVALDPLSTERLTGITAPQLLMRGYVYPERYGRGWVIPALPAGEKRRGYNLEVAPGMWGTWVADVAKALRVAQGGYAYETPTIFWRPPIAEWDAYVREFLLDPTRPLAYDTEYPWKRKAEMSVEEKAAAVDTSTRIDEANFAYSVYEGGSVPWEAPYIEGALAMLHASQQYGTTLVWNLKADGPRTTANGGPVFTAAHTEDLMNTARVWRNSYSRRLAVMASLWPSMERIAPWKHLGTDDPYYRGMDAIALIRGRRDMHAALRDEGQWDAYCTFVRDLDPILERMSGAGLARDVARIEALEATIQADMAAMQQAMTALVPVTVCSTVTWKGRKAAEAGLARLIAAGDCAPDAELEPVPGTMTVKRCEACGETGVTAAHVARKTLPKAQQENL